MNDEFDKWQEPSDDLGNWTLFGVVVLAVVAFVIFINILCR